MPYGNHVGVQHFLDKSESEGSRSGVDPRYLRASNVIFMMNHDSFFDGIFFLIGLSLRVSSITNANWRNILYNMLYNIPYNIGLGCLTLCDGFLIHSKGQINLFFGKIKIIQNRIDLTELSNSEFLPSQLTKI